VAVKKIHPNPLKKWKRDMIFGTWNVRSLYRSGSLTAVARKFARCKFDLVVCRKFSGAKGAW
jgi:hypothetical protein